MKFKVKVNREQSRELQESLFKMGYEWGSGSKVVNNLEQDVLGVDIGTKNICYYGLNKDGCISYEEALKRLKEKMGYQCKVESETLRNAIIEKMDSSGKDYYKGLIWFVWQRNILGANFDEKTYYDTVSIEDFMRIIESKKTKIDNIYCTIEDGLYCNITETMDDDTAFFTHKEASVFIDWLESKSDWSNDGYDVKISGFDIGCQHITLETMKKIISWYKENK